MLHRAIQVLARHGVQDIAVVVGHMADRVRRDTGSKFQDVRLHYFEAPDYATTGTAASLLRALPFLSEDAFVLEGDVVFEDQLIATLSMKARDLDLVAVAPFVPPLAGSVVHLDLRGKVTSFVKGVRAGALPGTAKTVNIYRFRGQTSTSVLGPALRTMYDASQSRRAYLEDVLSALVEAGKVELTAVHCGDYRWAEIDDLQDMNYAEAVFAPVGSAALLERA
jgi:NDP-sugar pyrophosphorylase family protein